MIIEKEILDILEEGRSEDNLFFLPDYQLDRKTYLKVNKVLECLNGKWNRKLKAHIFDSNISDSIEPGAFKISGTMVNTVMLKVKK